MTRSAWNVGGVVLLAGLFSTGAGCSEDDDIGPLQTQVAALETRMAQPTATPHSTPTPEPDRIVGVEWKCTLIATGDGETRTFELSGEPQCEDARGSTPSSGTSLYMSKDLKVLTVRTAQGLVYIVVVDGNDPAAIGDPWPR